MLPGPQWQLDDSPQDKKQKAATVLLRSKILGPISRFRIVEILPHMKLVSRAARPGLAFVFLRILCNVLCTAQRFHTEIEEQIGRLDHPSFSTKSPIENPGNFGDCMEGRIRFMTAITPAYAHAYQVTCLTRLIPAVQTQRFRLPSAKARYPHLTNIRATTRERGNNFSGICHLH